MFRTSASRLRFEPENGMKVLIRGSISVFERDGTYQIYCDDMIPEGVGELTIAFEQLKEKLSKEGLFDEEHKKELPRYPSRIGVITSPTGAALQDILTVLSRRYPSGEIVFDGVQVQGDSAAQQIADAIRKFNELGGADVLIVGRGAAQLKISGRSMRRLLQGQYMKVKFLLFLLWATKQILQLQILSAICVHRHPLLLQRLLRLITERYFMLQIKHLTV